ncbi:MAG TPA: caspase family protein [Pyrinomonadaceae bacterium]|nr:caspase family protein [Pyrinomonadaceae bacterium]
MKRFSSVLGFAVLVVGSIQILGQVDRQLMQESGDVRKRVALVIGNADYIKARTLANPANDATDMAKTLNDLGFTVINGTNLNLKQMNDKVREFGDTLRASGGVGLFYYAGHGIQVGGKNYLIPVDAEIPREDEIDFNALNLDLVLRKMATANNGLNIVILDACRNNPFARSWSRGEDEGGLAQISAPTGTFIAYSTSPDRTASDGSGRNGLYTTELLKVIRQPALKIEEAFKQVTIAVDRASSGKQVPWTSSSLRGDFYFNANDIKVTAPPVDTSAVATQTQQTTTAPAVETGSSELADWNRIKNSTSLADFQAYLMKYPRGTYSQQAVARMMQIAGAGGTGNIFGETTTSTAASGVFLVDGSNRVPLKQALTKQDYSGSAGIMGIGAGFKMMTAFNGGRASVRIKSGQPEFEYLLTGNVNVSDVLVVLKLKPKSDSREIQTMQRTFTGFKKEDTVSATFQEIPLPPGSEAAGKLYRIKFSSPLSPGEYAIAINQAVTAFGATYSAGQFQGVYYDFGVDGGK